ncbi:hypothetical protein RRG08_052106 [Elysia crispata]|uniref:Uncharacterized protein n=1 Tax=Elysia crispata TaxID=231223 RepID=A0AAE1DTD9_9GAST|nr:hypothetical protein RRG08_052106 [Elysia crispata]
MHGDWGWCTNLPLMAEGKLVVQSTERMPRRHQLLELFNLFGCSTKSSQAWDFWRLVAVDSYKGWISITSGFSGSSPTTWQRAVVVALNIIIPKSNRARTVCRQHRTAVPRQHGRERTVCRQHRTAVPLQHGRAVVVALNIIIPRLDSTCGAPRQFPDNMAESGSGSSEYHYSQIKPSQDCV